MFPVKSKFGVNSELKNQNSKGSQFGSRKWRQNLHNAKEKCWFQNSWFQNLKSISLEQNSKIKYGILKVINSKEETNLSNQTKYFWYDSFTTKFCFIERLGCIGTIQNGTDCMLVSQFDVPLGFLNVRLST